MQEDANYWARLSGSTISRRGLLRGAAIGGASLAAASLLGCGGSDEPGTSGTTTPGGGTGTATGSNGAATEGTPVEGGTFRWERTAPITLPHLPNRTGAGGAWSWKIDSNVAVRWNSTATELIPELIGSWENADGVDIVVRPPEGVKTHNKPLTNGRLWDAEDIAFNLEYISGASDPDDAATYSRRHSLRGLVSAEAIDDQNARVAFDQPTGHFPQGLCDYHIVMLPRENFLDETVAQDPTKLSTTGAFTIRDYRLGEGITYDRHPDYWQGTPHMLHAEWRSAADRVSQISSFLQGQSTYFESPTRVERETVAAQMPTSQYHEWPGSTVVGAMFNLNRPMLADPRVRHAMHLVANFKRHNDDFWGEGYYTLAGVLNNAFTQAMPEDVVKTLPGWRPEKDADVAEAVALMDAAGYPGGAGLDIGLLALQSDPVYSAYDFLIRWRDDLSAAFPQGQFRMDLASDGANRQSRTAQGDFDITAYVSGSVSPAALEMSTYYASDGASNYNGYANSEVDELLRAGMVTLDSEEHDEKVRQAEALVLEDLPRFVFFRIHQAMIYAPAVRGLPVVPGGDRPLAGNFENWGSVMQHLHKIWLEA